MNRNKQLSDAEKQILKDYMWQNLIWRVHLDGYTKTAQWLQEESRLSQATQEFVLHYLDEYVRLHTLSD